VYFTTNINVIHTLAEEKIFKLQIAFSFWDQSKFGEDEKQNDDEEDEYVFFTISSSTTKVVVKKKENTCKN